jgi:hypothetical protein
MATLVQELRNEAQFTADVASGAVRGQASLDDTMVFYQWCLWAHLGFYCLSPICSRVLKFMPPSKTCLRTHFYCN